MHCFGRVGSVRIHYVVLLLKRHAQRHFGPAPVHKGSKCHLRNMCSLSMAEGPFTVSGTKVVYGFMAYRYVNTLPVVESVTSVLHVFVE